MECSLPRRDSSPPNAQADPVTPETPATRNLREAQARTGSPEEPGTQPGNESIQEIIAMAVENTEQPDEEGAVTVPLELLQDIFMTVLNFQQQDLDSQFHIGTMMDGEVLSSTSFQQCTF